MKHLKSDHIRTVLDRIFTELVELLERSKAPWMRSEDRDPGIKPSIYIGGQQFADVDEYRRQSASREARLAVKNRDPSRWIGAATSQLHALGVEADQEDQLFRDFCVEIGKLELLFIRPNDT